jgi:hypothetical protein
LEDGGEVGVDGHGQLLWLILDHTMLLGHVLPVAVVVGLGGLDHPHGFKDLGLFPGVVGLDKLVYPLKVEASVFGGPLGGEGWVYAEQPGDVSVSLAGVLALLEGEEDHPGSWIEGLVFFSVLPLYDMPDGLHLGLPLTRKPITWPLGARGGVLDQP